MRDHTEPTRRAMALTRALADGDDLAVQRLRPVESPLAHLWPVDADGDV
jgi:hypothetical protein